MNSSLNATFCKRDHSREVIIQLNLLAIHKMCPPQKKGKKNIFLLVEKLLMYMKKEKS